MACASRPLLVPHHPLPCRRAPQPAPAQERSRCRVPNARGLTFARARGRPKHADCRYLVTRGCPGARLGRSPVPRRVSRRAQAERSSPGSRAATRSPLSRRDRGRAGAIEQALSAVHDHTSSAAHGGRAGGQRTRAERTPPGPPVPTTTPSIRMACRPTSRYVWFRGHAALCFKRRVRPARSADRTVERHPRQRTRCLACRLHSTLPARRCADCRPELAKIDDRAAGPEPHTAGAHGVAWARAPGAGPRDGTDLASRPPRMRMPAARAPVHRFTCTEGRRRETGRAGPQPFTSG